MGFTSAILQHYESPDLLVRIEEGLAKLGKSPQTATIDDLAPVDEFHVRGPAATLELIGLLDPQPDMQVLDLGAGLGGPARRLAEVGKCRVTGIDMIESYCAVGTKLNQYLGLAEQVTLQPGDVTELHSLDDESFDAAWSIHVGMNVSNKDALYREAFRVLKPGACFVLYDVLATDGRPDIDFPVPWAQTEEGSFLATERETIAYLEEAGFQIELKQDHTAAGLSFMNAGLARIKELGGPPPLGLHLIVGPVFMKMVPALSRNLAEERVRIVSMQCFKPRKQ